VAEGRPYTEVGKMIDTHGGGEDDRYIGPQARCAWAPPHPRLHERSPGDVASARAAIGKWMYGDTKALVLRSRSPRMPDL
jgi:hypothetical protein